MELGRSPIRIPIFKHSRDCRRQARHLSIYSESHFYIAVCWSFNIICFFALLSNRKRDTGSQTYALNESSIAFLPSFPLFTLSLLGRKGNNKKGNSNRLLNFTSKGVPISLRAEIFSFTTPERVARDFFCFGSGSKKFTRENEKILAPHFQETRAAIGGSSVRISETAGY